MLIARHLTHQYTNLEVLKGINSDSGQVLIDNTDVFALKDNELAAFRNQKTGFVFQFHILTLRVYCARKRVPDGFYWCARKRFKTKSRDSFAQTWPTRPPPKSACAAIGRRAAAGGRGKGFYKRPCAYFADEPGGNLDSRNAEELHQLFFALRDELNQHFFDCDTQRLAGSAR